MWQRVVLGTNTFRGLTDTVNIGHATRGYRVGPKDIRLDLVYRMGVFKCRSFWVGHGWDKVTWLGALFTTKITDTAKK